MPASLVHIRPLTPADEPWFVEEFSRRFGGPDIVSRGEWFNTRKLPGFAAIIDGQLTGAVVHTPLTTGGECEVVALASRAEGRGAGTALLDACVAAARTAGCRRVFLIVSNDNTPALRFYQKRGWCLAALYPGAITRARARKPKIPLTGIDGIPIRDELELDIRFEKDTSHDSA